MNGGPFYNQNPGKEVSLLFSIQRSAEWGVLQISEMSPFQILQLVSGNFQYTAGAHAKAAVQVQSVHLLSWQAA